MPNNGLHVMALAVGAQPVCAENFIQLSELMESTMIG
jgi:hypothetical protein